MGYYSRTNRRRRLRRRKKIDELKLGLRPKKSQPAEAEAAAKPVIPSSAS